jgi:hypothetical protein
MKVPLVVALALLLVVPLQAAPQVWRFDDFESAEHVTAHHLAWITLGDELFGGQSSLALENVRRGAHGSGHALRLHGQAGPAPTAFVGAWAPLDGEGRPVDLSAFDALRFVARGEGAFQAGLRSGKGMAVGNFMSAFTPGPDWKVFELPFDRLAAVGPGAASARWSPQDVHYLGITTAPGSHGPFRLEVDDLELVSHRGVARPMPMPQPGAARSIRVTLVPPPAGAAWHELATDPAGDGKQASLPDATAVAMADDGKDRIWFRVTLRDAPPSAWLGLNLALDVDGDDTNGTPWWGVNTAFHFDRLVSVYLFKIGDSYQGMAGTSDSAAVAQGEFMAGGHDVHVAIDRASPAFLVSIPRTVLGDGAAPKRVLAAVGSALAHNDDVPDTGRGLTVPGPLTDQPD